MATVPRRINPAAPAVKAPAPAATSVATQPSPAPEPAKTQAATTTSATNAVPAPVAAPVASAAPSTPAAPAPAQDDTIYQHKEHELITYLAQPSSIEALKVANPDIGSAASDAAIKYLEALRGVPATWLPLVTCPPESVLSAVRKLAAIGLTVSVDRGTAFLVPRPVKGGGMTCTGVPGIRGQEETIMAQFAPGRLNIETNCARAQDHFVATEGTTVEVVHRRNFAPDYNKPNPIIAAYSVVRDNQTGAKQVAVVGIRQTDTIVDKGKPCEKVITTFSTHDGRSIEPNRMGAEKACGYSAQRAVMRAIARTWLCGNKRIQEMLALEEAGLREQDNGDAAVNLGRGRSARIGKPQIVAPKVSEGVEIASAEEAPAGKIAVGV